MKIWARTALRVFKAVFPKRDILEAQIYVIPNLFRDLIYNRC